MRRVLSVLLSAAVVAMVLACSPLSLGRRVTGSGRLESRPYEISGFTAIDASHAFQVNVQRGDTFSVLITADDNLFDHLTVVRRGSALRLGLDPDASYDLGTGSLRADVTMPGLQAVLLSGASTGTVSGFSSAEPLAVDLSGASTLDGDITSGDARFDLSGASRATLIGAGRDLTIDVSGAGNLDLSEFTAVNASVGLSGGARASVNVSGRLEYGLSGGAHLQYTGSPSVGATDVSGGASVSGR